MGEVDEMICIHNDRFMQVSETRDGLLLTWKKQTSELSPEKFKEEAMTFVEIVKKRKVKNILVDMREFKYTLSNELIAWRNKQVISVYNDRGIEKFAFVSDKVGLKQDDRSNKFITRYFSTIKEAEEWLRNNG